MLRLAAFSLLLAASARALCPVGSVYDSSFNSCYWFEKTPASFLDAEHFCNSLGGHLADEMNAFENSYLAGMASGASYQTNFWIGINLLRNPYWSWTSDALMSYTNWFKGQPSNNFPCGFVRDYDQKWDTIPCNTLLPFACKFSPSTPLPEICQSSTCYPDTCPYTAYCTDGYTLNSRNCLCYKYYNSTYLSFTDANAACAKEGGMLAKIPSKEVNAFLTVLPDFQSTGETAPWIGLSCNSSSHCVWTDGTPLGNYSNTGFSHFDESSLFALSCALTQEYHFNGMWIMSMPTRRAYLCQKASLTAYLPLISAAEDRSTLTKKEFLSHGGKIAP